jgi:hypothetical protein
LSNLVQPFFNDFLDFEFTHKRENKISKPEKIDLRQRTHTHKHKLQRNAVFVFREFDQSSTQNTKKVVG